LNGRPIVAAFFVEMALRQDCAGTKTASQQHFDGTNPLSSRF